MKIIYFYEKSQCITYITRNYQDFLWSFLNFFNNVPIFWSNLLTIYVYLPPSNLLHTFIVFVIFISRIKNLTNWVIHSENLVYTLYWWVIMNSTTLKHSIYKEMYQRIPCSFLNNIYYVNKDDNKQRYYLQVLNSIFTKILFTMTSTPWYDILSKVYSK